MSKSLTKLHRTTVCSFMLAFMETIYSRGWGSDTIHMTIKPSRDATPHSEGQDEGTVMRWVCHQTSTRSYLATW
ncbi:hypothetical protein EDB85DRAFT_1214887 [Lactarius pseudohatsudake]|nr:hypothetical protein EDB85DRAFT_1214887 [Lactarius pseudohatsudake]